MVTPEVAFTGDTSGAVFSAPGFEDALAAKLLIIEATFLSEDVKLEHAQVCYFSGTHRCLQFLKVCQLLSASSRQQTL